jgi:hypothetical protein
MVLLLALGGWTWAQEEAQRREAIDVQDGELERREAVSFLVRDLRAGDRLEVRARGQSGNLDPLVAVMRADEPLAARIGTLMELLQAEIEAGRDPFAALPQIAQGHGISVDDDSGPGYDARLFVHITDDGDYRIFLTGGRDSLSFGDIGRRVSTGRYSLAVGLNASLGVQPAPRGESLLQREQAERPVSIQHLEGSVSPDRPLIRYQLKDLNWGESLRVVVSASEEGGNAPRVRLFDFGGKALALANALGNHPVGEFTYSFESRATNHSLVVESTAPERQDFVMSVGRGLFSRLTEASEEQGQPLVDQPIPVEVGLALEQIVNVDQKSENFGAVATIILTWEDARLSFSAASCNSDRQVFDLHDFERFLASRNVTWPQFILKNQQGNRWAQERVVEVLTNGVVTYFERFTTTFQAPEFDFRDFPLDSQDFCIHVRCLRPQEEFAFGPDVEHSSLGTKLGEEEWVMGDFQVEEESEGRYSGIAFRFTADRHVVYYTLRVLVPIGLIVMVGWMSFALRDYSKRIDISAGNMLAFIAFNFTISSDLPRLGYVTFIDMLMLVTFVVCALLIAANVYCRRQETLGNLQRVERLDRWLILAYPICFLVPPLSVYLMAL